MVQLLPEDFATKEVLDWKGLHLFHALFSSCSQKLRVTMSLKGLVWESHLLDLVSKEHLTARFLGINPRGRVPVLIDDGNVHIESNDIMLHLERHFSELQFVHPHMEDRTASMLEEENRLHLDLRTLTFRFMFDPEKPTKSEEDLKSYVTQETRTVRGVRDEAINGEAAFWRAYLEHGVDDDAARRSAQAFRRAFDNIEQELALHEYIMGHTLSVVDVAWLTDAQRLIYAGYPIKTLHPRLDAWRDKLMSRPEICKELQLPPGLDEHVSQRLHALKASQSTLADICFPELHAAL